MATNGDGNLLTCQGRKGAVFLLKLSDRSYRFSCRNGQSQREYKRLLQARDAWMHPTFAVSFESGRILLSRSPFCSEIGVLRPKMADRATQIDETASIRPKTANLGMYPRCLGLSEKSRRPLSRAYPVFRTPTCLRNFLHTASAAQHVDRLFSCTFLCVHFHLSSLVMR